MRLAVKDLFKIWSKRICSVSIVIGGMIFSQVFAWDDWDSFVWDDWDNMGMVDFSEHTVIAAQKFTDVSPVWTKTMGYINQLSGVTEPQDAYGRNAFRNIIKIGADAVEPLKVAAQDLSMNTDARKWALYLLGETASKEQAGEVRDFLLGVMNSAGGRYDWWHRAEAKNGLQRLYERFPGIKPVIEEPKVEGKLSNSAITLRNIKELAGVTEPQDAYGRNAFRNIIKIGADAVETLKAAAQDLSMNTDARKWALYLLGETASKEQAGEVRDFLLGVMNSAGGRYDWWHRAEAKNGLQRLYERFPKLEKSSNQEIEVEKTANLINNLSGWGGPGLSVRDRLPVDFLPTKRVY